jgi:hypothetical protein
LAQRVRPTFYRSKKKRSDGPVVCHVGGGTP